MTEIGQKSITTIRFLSADMVVIQQMPIRYPCEDQCIE